MQNDEPSAHVPFLPPVQVPLQQLAELVQVAPSATQAVALAQTWRVLSHWRLQQSVFTEQELPAAPQLFSREAQVDDVASHTCVQHCAFDVQATPTTLQVPPAPP